MWSRVPKNPSSSSPQVWANRLIKIGLLFFGSSLLILLLIYYPVLNEELKYRWSQLTAQPEQQTVALAEGTPEESATTIMHPVDEEFSIIIPKIGANAKIIDSVDPYNESEYQQKLTEGVAHAKGSAHPGSLGDTFLFAHSSANFYQAARYNSVFYLLNKLEKDDLIYVAYQKRLYKYKVTETKLVAPDSIRYLNQNHTDKTLTLMTCWPAGTTLQRLLVFAEYMP